MSHSKQVPDPNLESSDEENSQDAEDFSPRVSHLKRPLDRNQSDDSQTNTPHLERRMDFESLDHEGEEPELLHPNPSDQEGELGGSAVTEIFISNPLEFVEFGARTQTSSKKFGVTCDKFPFSFKNLDTAPPIDKLLPAAFQHAIDLAFKNAPQSDWVGAEVNHPAMDTPFQLQFRPREMFSPDELIGQIESMVQSGKKVAFDSSMTLEIVRITPPEGRGYNGESWRSDWYKCDFNQFLHHFGRGFGGTILTVKNKDWLCLARAVVLAKSRYLYDTGEKSSQYNSIRLGDVGKRWTQGKLARELMVKAGLMDLEKQSCGFPEIKRIQAVIRKEGFRLKVFQFPGTKSLLFDEENPALIPLYLLYHGNHYWVMKSPKILYGMSSFCDFCNRGYDDVHKCKKRCECCGAPGACVEERWVFCDLCNRNFKSEHCLSNHFERELITKRTNHNGPLKETLKPSSCMQFKKCKLCKRTVPHRKLPPQKHNCGEVYCSICKIWYRKGSPHLCYMQPIKDKSITDLKEGECEDDPNDIDTFVREAEEEQGETDGTRREHFAKHAINDKPSKYLFWDFETTQVRKKHEHHPETDPEEAHSPEFVEKKITVDGSEFSLGPVYEHIPNYCVARKVCTLCQGFWLSRCDDLTCKARNCEKCEQARPDCKVSGDHKIIFEGEDCRDKFCRFLFDLKKHKGITAVAHNAKGFDAQFLLRWLLENEIKIDRATPRGLSILSLEAMGIRVIDSLAFLPQSLASLPKTFNEPELKKGYFPYLFNICENRNYVGPYPDPDQYCPSEMKPKDRDKFYEWYNKHKLGVFDMQKEIREYTESDVDILLRCCMKFNNLFYAQTGIYPLDDAITIAQACNQVFRKNHLKPETIGIIPTGGYRFRERQSQEAINWLRWMNHKMGGRIQHARNGREKKIGKYKVDGFIEDSNTVLEFHGCVWHGCMRCYTETTFRTKKKVPGSDLSYHDAYQETVKKAEFIKGAGYKLIEMWECEWKDEKERTSLIGEFLKPFALPEIITGRDAMYGGRTNATVLWAKCKNGEKIYYYDVCSLYPYVCKYGKFPLGHPKVITEGFSPITPDSKPYFGLVRCKILPPHGLLHPVLPYKFSNRLIFPLCRTCLEENNQEKCGHGDEQRCITGTFVSLELDKAVDLGYKVMQIYEVWHYAEHPQYKPGRDNDAGLFSSYINQFLKLKQEKSGWPTWVKAEADKLKYVNDYEQREGVKLNPAEIEKNPGLRAIAKLMLNSFWGKFAQQENLTSTEFLNQPDKFFDIVLNRENEVTVVKPITGDTVAVSYKKPIEHTTPNPRSSVVLADFVTAQARLKLYTYLEKLQDRVLYFDTDSVIFITRPGDTYIPLTGDYLGDLTDELSDYCKEYPSCYIEEFVSCGPKQYSFKVINPESKRIVGVVTKCKGFSLNYTVGAHINFRSMKDQVRRFVSQGQAIKKVTIYQPQIKRTKTHHVQSEVLRKEQKLVYCKRVVQPNYTTLPFGY